jgi:Fic family protein
MKPEDVESSDFGRVLWDEDGDYWWFDPAALPREIVLDNETQLALSEADTALGRLSGVGGTLREPRLLMRPYAVREALASARIEGTQAKLSDVFQAQASDRGPRDRDLAEVTAHIAALEAGLNLAEERLDFDTLRRVHTILMSQHGGGKEPGELRTVPVWLGSPTDRPETAVFVPPVGQAMTDALASWSEFLAKPPRLPALIRAAMLHYQFLTVHPFIDGNGRVGRMLILLFLRHENKLSVPLLYVSPYFAAKRREYFDRLQAVREKGELQQWLQFFLTAVASQAEDGVLRARELLDLRERYRTELSSSRSRATEVVETLFTNPVITTALIRKNLGVTTQGALNLIRSLESRGWLSPVGTSGRGAATQWLAKDVFAIVGRDEEPTISGLPRSARELLPAWRRNAWSSSG